MKKLSSELNKNFLDKFSQLQTKDQTHTLALNIKTLKFFSSPYSNVYLFTKIGETSLNILIQQKVKVIKTIFLLQPLSFYLSVLFTLYSFQFGLSNWNSERNQQDRKCCNWTFVFDPSGRLVYYWSFIVSLAFLYNFWVRFYKYKVSFTSFYLSRL